MSAFNEENLQNISQANAESDFILKERLEAFKIFQEAPLETLEMFKKYAKHDEYNLPEVQMKQGELEFELPKIAETLGVLLLPVSDAISRSDMINIVSKIFNNGDKFSAFTNAFFNSGYFLYVPDNVKLLSPIIFRTKVDSPVISKCIVLAGASSEFSVLEEVNSNNGAASVYSSQVDIFSEEGAAVSHFLLQKLNGKTVSFFNKNAYTQKDSTINFYSRLFGGGKVRARNNFYLEKNGSTGKNFEIIFANESQKFDVTTKINSVAEFVKGESHSRGIFFGKSSGLIKGHVIVEKGSKNSDTYLTQHGMLLSKDASANALPFLEIQEQDVRRATHSASVAPVDEDQVFYLESRGLEEGQARKIIVNGFLQALLKNVTLQEAKEKFVEQIEKKFGEENV